jgi:lipopolysaccharide transport system permease protein
MLRAMTPKPQIITSERSKAAVQAANRDFIDGPMAWRVWLMLGFYDIRIRYKRTFLGPLWITIGTGVTFTLIAMVFSAVLKTDINQFLPYLGAGMIIWTFASGVANEAPQTFVQASHLIDSLRMPLTVHVLRCVCRNTLIFFHNLLVFVVVCSQVGYWPTAYTALILLTLPLFIIALYSGALILAILGARFRDIAQIVAVGLQLLFFLTPILWRVEDMPMGRKYWVMGSPLYHLVEIIRAPLLGKAPSMTSVVICAIFTLVILLIALLLFRSARNKIVHWL